MTASITDLTAYREARVRARREAAEAEQRRTDEEMGAAARLFVQQGQQAGFIPPAEGE